MTIQTPLTLGDSGRQSWLVAVADYVAAALCLGLVTGTVSVLGWLYGVYLDNGIGWNVHRLWMPLASEALFALTLFLLTCPMALLLPKRSFDFVVGGFLVFTASFAALVTLGILHMWAIALLALGLGVQGARYFQAHSDLVRRTCRYLAPAGGLIVLAIIGTVIGSRAWQERKALDELPPAPAKAPNVLLVVWDTVRADYVETLDEGGAKTPQLNHLSERGFVFERAISTAPWTLPSHTSMFTGEFPNEFSASWYTPIDPRQRMLAEALRDHGYQTGGFVANTIYCGRGAGMDRGFLHYEDDQFVVNPLKFYNCNYFFHLAFQQTSRLSRFKPGPELTDDFVRWLETTRRDRPFFAFLNYMDAHTPYLPKTINGRPLTDREVAKMRAFEKMDPEEINDADLRLAQECYRAQITALDQELGRLLESLRQRNALDETVVIVVSDHGEHFGEHGLFLHGNSLYNPLVHVPLVIACPGKTRGGKRVPASVSLRNMAATILDCAGVRDEAKIRGRSLLKITEHLEIDHKNDALRQDAVYAYNRMDDLKTNNRHAPLAVLEKSVGWQGPLHLWVDGDFFLIRGPEAATKLFDVGRNPHETHDLTLQTEWHSQFNIMQAQLDEFLERMIANHPETMLNESGP